MCSIHQVISRSRPTLQNRGLRLHPGCCRSTDKAFREGKCSMPLPTVTPYDLASSRRLHPGRVPGTMTTKGATDLNSFLAEGLTHREVDLTLGLNPARSKGWRSFEVLTNKFGIVGADRGALFLYSRAEVKRVVAAIGEARSRAPLDRMLTRLKPPAVLEPYRDTYAVARGVISLQRMLSGEARNAIQRFFDSRKTAIGRCQMQGCTECLRLDTVHLLRTRPVLFARAARKHCTHGRKECCGSMYMRP